MRLEPFYRATFTTPESWTVELAGPAGVEGQSFTHSTDDERYRWLNGAVCALAGEVRPDEDGSGFEVVLDVSELVWEPLS